MPGWPTVDRADDHQLADALRRADPDAPARLYDAYAERLHDYACSLTGDRDSAADSVHDAIVTAQGRVDRLKEGTRLRSWLYALTRFQAMARLARKDDEGLPPPVLDDPDDPELAELVHEALGELSRNEREVLELSVRHGLTPAEVGGVLGLTSRQAASRLGRARDHLENAAAAVVLARTGRAHCPDLSAMVDSWEGPLTPLLRRRLSGHISGCEVCTEGRHRQVSAARLLDLVPVAFPPISLRRRVIDTCGDPESDQTRVLITDRSDSFDRSGFPAPARSTGSRRRRGTARRRETGDPTEALDLGAGSHRLDLDGHPRRRRRRLAPVLLSGIAVLAATGTMVVLNRGADGTDAAALHLVPTPSATATSAEPDLQTATEPPDDPTTTSSPELTVNTTPPPTSRPAPAATTTRPAAPAPTATRRRPLPGAKLAVSCPGTLDGAAKIGLSARNATVTWSATSSAGLDVFPATGTIKAGGSVAIWVTANNPDEAGSGSVSFASNGGGAGCSLTWHGHQPQVSDPPTDVPSSPPATPTDTAPSGGESSTASQPLGS
ncbi:sigma-70 family RNA polymerase sigma factor [Nonomuraea sediminis]|uniref:sigma-70 family RNA polymerase sigma factor n=1 Tax=Nonomuraea sediminis TaxID=2835864 RepID=UPI001BDCB6A3|nr:sigma-70 family RNA polymerase sigma factor [Nonomuraea sediminis]